MPVAILQLEQEGQDLVLDGDVERRRRLVGEQQLAARPPSPWRSRRAAACRPTIGRGIRRSAWPGSGCRRDPEARCPRSRAARCREPVVDAQPFGDLVADRPDRIEAGHRILEDHARSGAAHAPHLLVVQPQEVAPLEADLARADEAGRRWDQAQDAAAEDRLAAAGFADDAKRRGRWRVERDVGIGADGRVTAAELGGQAPHLEQRRRPARPRPRGPLPPSQEAVLALAQALGQTVADQAERRSR